MIFWFFSGTTTTYQKDNFWFHESIWKSALFPPKWNWLQQALLAYYSLRNYCLPEKRGPLIGMPEILYCFGAATNQNDRLRKNEMKEVFFFYSQNVANFCIGPSAIDSDSLKPLSVLHSKLKFEWWPINFSMRLLKYFQKIF